MSELNEKLSIVLDEFSGDQQCHAALDEVSSDVNLQYQFRRYQMIGEVMRHELPDEIQLDLNHRVMGEVAKIESGVRPAGNAAVGSKAYSGIWAGISFKPFAGFALAASVAVVSVITWQSLSIGPQPGQSGQQVVSVEQQKIEKLASQPLQAAVPASSQLNEGTRWNVNQDSPALQQKLNGYLVNHTEYASPMQGLIPQARVAGYDAQK